MFKLRHKITPFPWYDHQASDAAELYIRLLGTGRIGLSWQIIPKAHMQMMSDSDGARVARVVQTMMLMSKLDIAALQRAHVGA
jgi:predicted 3-demethylubiquinone-9 3-methyltransferase (glyoxalase superfamily)